MQEKSKKEKLEAFLAMDGKTATQYGMNRIKMGLWSEQTMQRAMKLWIKNNNDKINKMTQKELL